MSQSPTYKTPRPMNAIQQDYQNACLKAGDLQYKIFALQKDLAVVNEALLEFNMEGHAAQQAAQEKAQAEAKEKAEEEAEEEAKVSANLSQLVEEKEPKNG